ncbi:hypothetical protein BX265_6887 [Streptomyces sp. TLI_235]|nr:hypothetical protein [Streptomyces sp. TLI_235]PBC69558.1 hypothetical protein BX265_6887 [Streptomyces sp. TLI_235]
MNPYRSLTAPALVLAVIVALAGCGSGAVSDHGPPAAAASAPSPSYAPVVPTGWIRGRVDGLTFARPADLTPRSPAERAQPSAAVELGGPVTAQVPVSPGFFIFEQNGAYGDADAQAAATIRNYKARLGQDPAFPAARLAVPGAETALLLEFDFPYTDGRHPVAVPSRQFEIYIQAPHGGSLYGIRFGGPATYLSRDMGERLASTLRLTPTRPENGESP